VGRVARREGAEAGREVALLAAGINAEGDGAGRGGAGEEGQEAGLGGVESGHASGASQSEGLLDRRAILVGLEGGALGVISVGTSCGGWLLGGKREGGNAPLGLQSVEVADQRLQRDDPLLAAEAAPLEEAALHRESQRECSIEPHAAGAAIEEDAAPSHCPRLPEAHSHHRGAQPGAGDRVIGLAHVDEEQPAGDAQLSDARREVEMETHVVADVPAPQKS
jgi:hypothetical protein